MNRKGLKLIKTTTIYFIGTIIVKLINIIFLPIILSYLSAAEYGYYDLIVTTISLILPIFTLQSIDAVFRFLYDADDKKKQYVLSSVWAIIIVGSIIFILIAIVINQFILNIQYLYLIVFYYVSNVFINMYQRIARSYGYNACFALSGIIHSTIMLVLMLVFLIIFDMKVDGMLLSYILSSVITCIYLEWKVRAIKGIKLFPINFQELIEIIKFSIPLVPNTISWWAVTSINKYIIVIFLGQYANGIYAVTLKFSSILTMISGVFILAWQESSITEYKNKDNDKFISTTFNKYFTLLILISSVGILGLKVVYKFFVPVEYMESWVQIPIVMLGTVLSSIASFYGAGYLASKKTMGAFFTTIIASIVNIIANLVLINKIGIVAAPVSVALAFLTLWILRHNKMKSYYRVNLNIKNIIALFSLYAIVSLIYYNCTLQANIITLCLITFGLILYSIRELKSIIIFKETKDRKN